MKTIVIDAGHGYRREGHYDPGAVGVLGGVRYEEAQVALRYAVSLAFFLRQTGYSVRLTRVTNGTIRTYTERVSWIRNADAGVSLHLNAHTESSATGYETLYRVHASFAHAVHRGLQAGYHALEHPIPDRGVKLSTRSLAMLSTPKPSVIVELGFISNPVDLRLLLQNDTRITLMRHLAEGIRRAFL